MTLAVAILAVVEAVAEGCLLVGAGVEMVFNTLVDRVREFGKMSKAGSHEGNK